MLIQRREDGPFAAGVALFNFAWSVTTPFELAFAATAGILLFLVGAAPRVSR